MVRPSAGGNGPCSAPVAWLGVCHGESTLHESDAFYPTRGSGTSAYARLPLCVFRAGILFATFVLETNKPRVRLEAQIWELRY